MKRLAVVLLAVVLALTLLCLGATQRLVNQSGAAASGVVVTFSEAVEITSYDKSVFPAQSPTSGESESFTFSGRALAAGGTFQVTWSPSSVKLRSTNWITSGSGKVAAASASAIPTTYEELMAQIAHYPGADEPLYVPGEGATIWLTDLEGHADIYDNDSIKINYAPWFDKSQITKVEVYRNGIKMRFLPDKLDVVTNEQMKTFDGNPEEHSPASSHTDHAIMGYEYQFRFTASSAGASLPLLSAIARSGATYSGEIWFFPGGGVWRALDKYGDDELKAQLEALSSVFDGVVLRTVYFMMSDTTSDLVPLYDGPEEGVTPTWGRTLTRDEILRFLRICGEVGLPAEVGVQVWLSENYAAAHKTQRSAIKPQNVADWFSNYTAICVEIAQIAQEGGAVVFCPFVEMNSLAQYPEKIAEVGAAVRQVFAGRLAFDEATHHYLKGFNTYSEEKRLARNAVSLTNDYDVLEMNWWDIPGLDVAADQHYSVIVKNAIRFWEPAFSLHRQRHPWAEIDFGEAGSRNYDGGVLGRENHPETHPQDYQESSDLWAAIIATAECYGAGRAVAWQYAMGGEASSVKGIYPGHSWLNIASVLRILQAWKAP